MRLGRTWFLDGAWVVVLAWVVMVMGESVAVGGLVDEMDNKKGDEKVSAEGQLLGEAARGMLAQLRESGDRVEAGKASEKLYQRAVARVGKGDVTGLEEVVYTHKLVRLCRAFDEKQCVDFLELLEKHRGLGRVLVYQIRPEDRMVGVYDLLKALDEKYGKGLDAYANLAVAVCVVHDQGLKNKAASKGRGGLDGLGVYGYYRKFAKRMRYDIKKMAADQLIYVVDNSLSLGEMSWALEQYGGVGDVGRIYFDVGHRDPKKGNNRGAGAGRASLAMLKKEGGSYAEKSYFVVGVAKSLGIAAGYFMPRGKRVRGNYQWPGYLRDRGGKGYWDFNARGHEMIGGDRGLTRDPQTGLFVSDCYVSFHAGSLSLSAYDRQCLEAYLYVARRLSARDYVDRIVGEDQEGGFKEHEKESAAAMKKIDLLVEKALGKSGRYMGIWEFMSERADLGQLSLKQKQSWAEKCFKAYGKSDPFFALDFILTLIKSETDLSKQNAFWEKTLKAFGRHPFLAGEIRLGQGAMWEEAKKQGKAGRCYLDIVYRYPHSGSIVMEALARFERSGRGAGDVARLAGLYEAAWGGTALGWMGREGYWFHRTNWYRLGAGYSQLLRRLGKKEKALAVLKQVHQARRKARLRNQ